MQDLNSLPWRELTHAHGSAEDVPGLLRALRTSPPNDDRDHGPLARLFGSIWHQNTVYEATAYAVPYLIELAADPQVRDRVGVLKLLAAIAGGTSFLQVHESFLQMYVDPSEPSALSPADRKQWRQKNVAMIPGTPEFERKKAQEVAHAQAARQAVAAGLPVYLQITSEPSAIKYSAAYLLSRLRGQAPVVGDRLLEMIRQENNVANRAKLTLLLSQLSGQAARVIELCEPTLDSPDIVERRAAALALAMVSEQPLSTRMKKFMLEVVFDDDLIDHFLGDGWFNSDIAEIARDKLLKMVGDDQDALIEQYLEALKQPQIPDRALDDLMDLVFRDNISEKVRIKGIDHRNITPLQRRVLQAIIDAMDRTRWWNLSWFSYNLPDSRRSLRQLAQGRPYFKCDEAWPRLSLADTPGVPAEEEELRVGTRVHSRFWGYGTIVAREYERYLRLEVEYDEEGYKAHDVRPETPLSQFGWQLLNSLRPWLGKRWMKPKTLDLGVR